MIDKINVDLLTEVRKELHAHPEVSENEIETQNRIISFLSKRSNAKIIKVANTGVLAVFNSEKEGKTIMIRGDIDALPIQETNSFNHKSKTKGVSHKCGHDGHTTILLGLAQLISETPIKKGKVLLLFQPAEENGVGAQSVLNDIGFNTYTIDYVFALHNLPGYKTNNIIVKENEFTGNVKSIIIKLQGKTSHAAEPEKGYNPASAVSNILNYAEKNTNNQPQSKDFFLITPIYVTLGKKAYGISAGEAEVHLTIRSWSTSLMNKKCDTFVNHINKIAQDNNLSCKIKWTQVFHANCNNTKAVNIIRSAAKNNNLEIIEVNEPFKWGEDFGLFTQKYKGAMFGIGAGKNTPALHNPDYDFPDEIIQTGILMFYQIIKKII